VTASELAAFEADAFNAPKDRGSPKRRNAMRRQSWVANKKRTRLLLFRAAKFLMMADNLRRARLKGDLDLACVVMTVWLRALEVGLRDETFRNQFGNLDRSLDFSEFPWINATSIAAATGLPRETVRRKLKELVKEGMIINHGAGRFSSARSDTHNAQLYDAYRQISKEGLRFINTCVAEGLIRADNRP
jgi:hypothetical protein